MELVAPDHPYVGRGGVKLAHALDVFAIVVAGRRALDVGASTGGFTDVLLQRGAASVIALDVGRGQLDWRLRTDPRVVVRERVNARALTDRDVPHAVDLVTIDVSFISLRHIFPALPPFLAADADIVALVKPQFEAGREEVGKHGLVTDPAVHDAVIAACHRRGGRERSVTRRDDTVADHRRNRESGVLPPSATKADLKVCTTTVKAGPPTGRRHRSAHQSVLRAVARGRFVSVVSFVVG